MDILEIKEELMRLLIIKIKSKTQINGLKDEYIQNKLKKYFLTNPDKRKRLNLEYKSKLNKIEKSKYFKEVIKNIREEIGIVYGSYLTSDFLKKDKILKNLDNKADIEKLLKLHKSTRERVDYYDEIYSKIFNWYKPKRIADLACGLNPISIFYMQKYLKYMPEYFATDLNPNDMIFLNNFFNKFKIEGIARDYDLVDLDIENEENIQKADLIFLFKAVDSLEQIKKNITKNILFKLKSKNIVISFPTKSIISKKQFKIEKRNWFFRYLNENKYKYEQFEIENELFILIEKKV